MDGWNPNDTFEALGHALDEGGKAQPTPGMHKTRSLDYAIVLAGEIWAVMDEGETLLKPGDVLIQRGTNHGWSNRAGQPARVAFVLIDAVPLKGIGAG
jgi:quercetin dioxygenase-like cupin family protein